MSFDTQCERLDCQAVRMRATVGIVGYIMIIMSSGQLLQIL